MLLRCESFFMSFEVQLLLQVYICDCQFDFSCWVVLGMLVVKWVNCYCKEDNLLKLFKFIIFKVMGVFGNELFKDKIQIEIIKLWIGLICDKGYCYFCLKIILDVMEVFIGVYFEYGRNCEGVLKFMIWVGIDVYFDFKLMEVVSKVLLVDLSYDYGEDLKVFEKRIGYMFKNKYFLLEVLMYFFNMVGD